MAGARQRWNAPIGSKCRQPGSPSSRYDIAWLQCRAARALLEWSQAELAYQARVAAKTVADFERGATEPNPRTLARIAETRELAGIELLNDGAPACA